MGGFLGGIGAAAQGFEQAHHDEMQREFATEQGNRQAALEMFRTFALDPNQPDELRQAAFQSWQNVAQTPYGKFKLEKHVAPFQELIGQHNARKILGQAPPPPTSVQTPAMQAGGPPQFTPSTEGPPQMSGGQLNLPATTSSVQGPPPPPPNLFAGIPEIAQSTEALARAQAGGTLGGQIQARQALFSQIPEFKELPPEYQAMLLGGQSLVPLIRSQSVEGQSVSGADILARDPEATKQGVTRDQFYNVKQTPVGTTYVQTAGRGQVASNGGLIDQSTAAGKRTTATQQAEMPFWQKKNQIMFGQKQALLNQAFELGVQRGYYGDANRAFVDSVKDYGVANKTMQSMDEAFRAVQANPNNQQAQVALLMAHIGMTLGVVKGARVGKAQIEEAEQSRTMFAGAGSKLNFDKDGNLDWSDPIRKGVTLTPDQMKQMVELGHQRMQILHDNIGTMHDQLDPTQMAIQPITPTPMSKGAKKAKSSGPPAPPSETSVPTSHQSFAEWQAARKKEQKP